MTETETLAQLILKEYYRSLTDYDAFEWVELEHLTQFIAPLLSISGTPTDVGVWILPLDVQELKEACRYQIESNDDYHREALSIAVLAGWEELGPVVALSAGASEGADIETIACARAAEVLGSFTPEIADRLRSILKSGIEDQEDDEDLSHSASTVTRALETAACLLIRNGTDDDREYARDLVRDAILEPAFDVLVSLLDEGWDVAELFKNLQMRYFPEANRRDIDLFCELSKATWVHTDFDRLVELGRSDWIEGILLRMLQSPMEFLHESGTYDHAKTIRNGTAFRPITDLTFVRLNQEMFFDAEEIEEYMDHPRDTIADRITVYLARDYSLSEEDFSDMAEQEDDPDLSLILRMLSNKGMPGSLHDDLALVALTTKEAALRQILINDPHLVRGDRDTHFAILRAAAKNEVMSDSECTLLFSCFKQPWAEDLFLGTDFDWKVSQSIALEGIDDYLFRAAVNYGGRETRALLLNRLLTGHADEEHLAPLLILISYLDGTRWWFEDPLMRFWGTKENDELEQIGYGVQDLIAWVQRSNEAGINPMISEMTDEDLRRRPEILSYMWDSCDPAFWNRAWRVASTVPNIHPLLSKDQATDGEAWRPSVAVAHRLVTSEGATEFWRDIEKILSAIGPKPEWPECLKLCIRTKEKEIFGFGSLGVGDVLSHSRILSVMSIGQPASNLDDQGVILPTKKDQDEASDEFRYMCKVGYWRIDYESTFEYSENRPEYTLEISYGPLEDQLLLDGERHVVRTHHYESSFEVKNTSDLELVREFYDHIEGAVLTKSSLEVFINESSFLEAGVGIFGNAGDLTTDNALYDYVNAPSQYFVKGWMVWGNIQYVRENDKDIFRWLPNEEMNEWIDEYEAEDINETFGEISVEEIIRIKREFVLRDESTIRENFQRWGIECDKIV